VFAQHSAGMQHYLNQPSIPQKEGREATDYGFRYPPPLVREAKIPTHFQGLCAHYSSNQLADNDLEFIMRRTPRRIPDLVVLRAYTRIRGSRVRVRTNEEPLIGASRKLSGWCCLKFLNTDIVYGVRQSLRSLILVIMQPKPRNIPYS
jgi:hypothetical protein